MRVQFQRQILYTITFPPHYRPPFHHLAQPANRPPAPNPTNPSLTPSIIPPQPLREIPLRPPIARNPRRSILIHDISAQIAFPGCRLTSIEARQPLGRIEGLKMHIYEFEVRTWRRGGAVDGGGDVEGRCAGDVVPCYV